VADQEGEKAGRKSSRKMTRGIYGIEGVKEN
jgi:hypothetical protein